MEINAKDIQWVWCCPVCKEEISTEPKDNYIRIENHYKKCKEEARNKDLDIKELKEFADKYGDMKKFRERSPQNRAYLNFIADYAAPDDIRCFESDDYTVEFIKYDWLLNEQPPK